MHSHVSMRKGPEVFMRTGKNSFVISYNSVVASCRLREILMTMGDRFSEDEVCKFRCIGDTYPR